MCDRHLHVLRLVSTSWLLLPFIRRKGSRGRGRGETFTLQPHNEAPQWGQSSGAAAAARKPVQEQVPIHPRQQDPAREGARQGPGERAPPAIPSSPRLPSAVGTVRPLLHLRWDPALWTWRSSSWGQLIDPQRVEQEAVMILKALTWFWPPSPPVRPLLLSHCCQSAGVCPVHVPPHTEVRTVRCTHTCNLICTHTCNLCCL